MFFLVHRAQRDPYERARYGEPYHHVRDYEPHRPGRNVVVDIRAGRDVVVRAAVDDGVADVVHGVPRRPFRRRSGEIHVRFHQIHPHVVAYAVAFFQRLVLVGQRHVSHDHAAEAPFLAQHLRQQRASGVALAAWEKIGRGESGNAASLVPNYLRLSQAERARLEKTKTE